MKNILAIDTSSEACSASLLYQGTCHTLFEISPQAHSQLVLQMCKKLLDEAQMELGDLDALACCRGPGSFTGLRIGAGVIQGLAYSHDLPVVMVSSLEALAQGVSQSFKMYRVLPIIDARMHEVYWAQYSFNSKLDLVLISDEALSEPEEIIVNFSEPIIGVGSGWDLYFDRLTDHFSDIKIHHILHNQHVSAENIVTLAASKFEKGEWVKAENALPVYLRNNVVHQKSQR